MASGLEVTRRTFVEAFMLGAVDLAAQGQSGEGVPKRPLGRTGLEVSVLGIGGYHLGSVDTDAEATQIVNEALDAGVSRRTRFLPRPRATFCASSKTTEP